MTALVHEIAQTSVNRLIRSWKLSGSQIFLPQQAVHTTRFYCSKELPFGIRPIVSGTSLQEQRTRCNECGQHVCINRQLCHIFAIVTIVCCKLIGETALFSEVRHCLTKIATADGSTTLTRTTCQHHCYTLITSSCPHNSLAKTRRTSDSNALGINIRILFKIVDYMANPPSPGRHRTPFVGSRFCLAFLKIETTNTKRNASKEVRIDICIMECRETKTLFQEFLDCPVHTETSETTISLNCNTTHTLGIPVESWLNAILAHSHIVRHKADVEQQGDRPICLFRQIDKDIYLGSIIIGRKIDCGLLTYSHAIHAFILFHSVTQFRLFGRPFPILVLLKKFYNLRSAFFHPLLSSSHRSPIEHHQRVRQSLFVIAHS